MQSCWKRYSSERPHFDQIVTIVTAFLNRVKRPGSTYYSDSESDDGESNLQRQPSGKLPSRTPSLRSGMLISQCITKLFIDILIDDRYPEPSSNWKHEASK